jgi:hypothetical protein
MTTGTILGKDRSAVTLSEACGLAGNGQLKSAAEEADSYADCE